MIHKDPLTGLLLLCGFVLIPVITPAMGAIDLNGPRFLLLSGWSFITGMVLIVKRRQTQIPGWTSYFLTGPGAAYSLFILLACLSLTQAVNLKEGVTSLSRLLSLFIASILISRLFLSQTDKWLSWLMLVLTGLLTIESLAVWLRVIRFITLEEGGISLFGWVYGNKNILAAAVLLKIPATLWLILWGDKRPRRLAWAGLILAVPAIFFLSSRTTYLGLLALYLFFFLILIIRRKVPALKSGFKTLLLLTLILALSWTGFSLTQKHLYPADRDWSVNQGVVDRFSSTLNTDSDLRLASWKRTLRLIGEHPLLGTGTGNWKIRVLEYETPDTPDFKYMYRNHNDFLEMVAETGLAGGLSYAAIFVLVVLALFTQTRQRDPHTRLPLFFYPAFGILLYGIDSLFNFPTDRPATASYFVLATGMAAALLSNPHKIPVDRVPAWVDKLIPLALIGILPVVIGLQVLQVKSLRIQRIVKEDLVRDAYSHPAAFFVREYPRIPDINVVGTPVLIDQVRYLLHENQHELARDLLLADRSSPHDPQREYYLGLVYARLNQADSALLMLEEVVKKKPLFVNGVILYTALLADNGAYDQALKEVNLALTRHPGHPELLAHQETLLAAQPVNEDLADRYELARQAYRNKEYKRAITLINSILEQRPDVSDLYAMRAWCHYFEGHYLGVLQDLAELARTQSLSPELIQLRNAAEQKISNN